jgi:hypothetical protein
MKMWPWFTFSERIQAVVNVCGWMVIRLDASKNQDQHSTDGS